MNYSELTDFEINKAVADIVMNGTWHLTPSHPDNKTGGWLYGSNGIQTYPLPDYCSNPADAWPIIVDNGISIVRFGHGMWCADAKAYWVDGVEWQIDGECNQNPLRAAMITFLKIRNSSNANPI